MSGHRCSASHYFLFAAIDSELPTVLDLGCGTGVPISQVLIERRFKLYGLDASPTIVLAFRTRFPGVPVECADVEDSGFSAQLLMVSSPGNLLERPCTTNGTFVREAVIRRLQKSKLIEPSDGV